MNFVRGIASVLVFVLLGSLCIYAQETKKEVQDKESPTNCLRIANQVDLKSDLARLENMRNEEAWTEVISTYETLLKNTREKLVLQPDGVYVQAAQFLRGEMARLGPRAREIYRIKHDRAAERKYRFASETLDEKRLLEVVNKYPLSTFADDALSLLAAINGERGDFDDALKYVDLLLEWCPDTDLKLDALLMSAAWYGYFTGKYKRVKFYLDKLSADDGSKVEEAGRFSLAELMELLKRSEKTRHGSGMALKSEGIPGGGFNRAGVSGSVGRIDRIEWQGNLVYSGSSRKVVGQARFRFNQRRRAVSPDGDDYRYQSTVYGDKLYCPTETGINVIDMRTGRLLVHLKVPGDGELFPGMNTYLAPTITENSIFANFVHEVSNSEDYNGILIKAAIPRYTLCAFDRHSGKLLWMADRDKKFNEHFSGKWHSITSAPVVVDDNILIAEVKTRGQLAGSHLAAFNAKTGEMKWVVPLCSNGTELTMFGYDARGPLSTMPASSGGAKPTVYCCTNLGAVFAVDALTGAVKWAAKYDEIPLRAARHYYAQMRNIIWMNNPPMLSSGVLVVAPLDSEYVYGFDADTGKILWRYNSTWQNSQFQYIVGIADKQVVLAGARLAAIELDTGKVKWVSSQLGTSKKGPRGLIAGDQILVPRPDGVYRFSLQTGKMLSKSSGWGSNAIGEAGNLLEVNGKLLVTGRSKVTLYRKKQGK